MTPFFALIVLSLSHASLTGSVTRTGAGIGIIVVAGVGLHLVPPSSWDVGGGHVVLWKPPVSTGRWGISHERERAGGTEKERARQRDKGRDVTLSEEKNSGQMQTSPQGERVH